VLGTTRLWAAGSVACHVALLPARAAFRGSEPSSGSAIAGVGRRTAPLGLSAVACSAEARGLDCEQQASLPDLRRREADGGRRKRRRRICAQARVLLAAPIRANETWTMDFPHDALASGRKVRTLSIEDAYTREMLAIEVDTSLPALPFESQSTRETWMDWGRCGFWRRLGFLDWRSGHAFTRRPLRSCMALSNRFHRAKKRRSIRDRRTRAPSLMPTGSR
jgi:hypothetical protein